MNFDNALKISPMQIIWQERIDNMLIAHKNTAHN